MKKFLIAAVALSVLGSAGAAAAQPYSGGGYERRDERRDDRYDRRDERRDDRAERRDDRYDRRDDRRDDRYERRDDRYDRRDDRRDSRYERRADRRYNAGHYYAPRGYQQGRRWSRGQYLPPAYRDRGYYVDYRAYRLPPPPRGYGYYRHGDDVIMTAIATGLIASVVFNLFD